MHRRGAERAESGTKPDMPQPLCALCLCGKGCGMSEKKIRVLIVDDQALIRTGIATLLARKADIEVVGQASNGQEAIEQAAGLDPDVVLMDVMMPLMDGV